MFTSMQYVPIALATAFAVWCARKHRSLFPLWLLLGGALAYLAEPLLTTLGLIWYPPQGMNVALSSMGRSVPVFGFLAYAWFLGGTSVLVYDRIKSGMTMKGLWTLYFILVVVESSLEIPGLNMNVFSYYGNQPFVLLKFPMWWPFMNAAGPMVAGAMAYRMEPYIKPLLQPAAIYTVALSNAMVMFGAGLPMYFTLNTGASLAVTHMVGALTISIACYFVYMVTLLAGSDSPALQTGMTNPARR